MEIKLEVVKPLLFISSTASFYIYYLYFPKVSFILTEL